MYRFTFLAVPHLLCALVSFSAMAFVLSRKRSRTTTVFGLFLTGIGLWQLANVLVLSAASPETATFWSRLAYVGVMFIPIALFHYCVVLGELRVPR
jgi:hypothetical protein